MDNNDVDARKAALSKMILGPDDGMQNMMAGHYNDTGRQASSPGEYLDSVTGAPARTVISGLQNGNFNMDTLKAGYDQIGRDPQSAPTGQDLVAKTGVTNPTAQKVLGGALNIASDPASYFGGAGMGIPMSGVVESVKAAEVPQQFSKVQQMFQAGDKIFPANNAAHALQVKRALEQTGQIGLNRALTKIEPK
jgi:hypothetical protein